MPAAVPTGSDIETFLAESQIDHSLSLSTLDRYAAAGVERFNRESGWLPFFASNSDTTREFDPPGFAGGYDSSYTRGGERKLLLRTGLVSLTSLTVAAVAKTLNTDFWLRPSNAVDEGRPYTIVEFRAPVYGEPNTIAIVGRWGYCTVLPDDAFESMLQFGAILAARKAWVEKVPGVTAFADEEVNERFSDKPFGGMVSDWEADALATAHRYGDMSHWF